MLRRLHDMQRIAQIPRTRGEFELPLLRRGGRRRVGRRRVRARRGQRKYGCREQHPARTSRCNRVFARRDAAHDVDCTEQPKRGRERRVVARRNLHRQQAIVQSGHIAQEVFRPDQRARVGIEYETYDFGDALRVERIGCVEPIREFAEREAKRGSIRDEFVGAGEGFRQLLHLFAPVLQVAHGRETPRERTRTVHDHRLGVCRRIGRTKCDETEELVHGVVSFVMGLP
ncbi:MAG: hypothetical protein ABW186_11685 [Rhodanobacteraceae bacterium]